MRLTSRTLQKKFLVKLEGTCENPQKKKRPPSLLGQECASVGFGKSQVSGEVLSEGGGLYKMESISYTKKGEL